jgi:glucose/arabinose dehydrogenase
MSGVCSSRKATRCITILTIACGSAPGIGLQAQDGLPGEFEQSTIASGLAAPIALTAAGDGRLFVAQRSGAIRIIKGGQLQSEPYARIEVYTPGEGGLLGLALHPDFAVNGRLFALATVSADEQQILRIFPDGTSDPIRGGLPTTGYVHNGGGLRVGPDDHLYFGIGDTGRPQSGPDLTTLAGKICRIRLDGSTPEDNPFRTPTGSPRAIWALGFRNPFRMCFAPDGRLFVSDVGSQGAARREELNLIERGQDYGWPDVEGPSAFADLVDPILAYADEGTAITGCVYYDDDHFPARFRGDLFHLDYTRDALYHVDLDGDTVIGHTLFARDSGGGVDVIVDHDGSLVYCGLFSGEVRRIRCTLPGKIIATNPENPVTVAATGTTPVGACGAGTPVLLLMACGVTPLIRRRSAVFEPRR